MNPRLPPPPDGSSPGIDPGRIQRNWLAIETELFAPQPSPVERWLRRLTVPPAVARLMVATPALRRAWFVAIGLVVLIGLGAGDGTKPRDDLFLLLLLAPLVPVLGVTLAYGPTSDPAHETSLATPMSGLRLIMIRAATVVGCSVALLALASLLTGTVTPMAFGWLLPALGLTAASLALMTFTAPRRAGTITTVVWVVGVVLARSGRSDPLIAFTVGGQILMVLVAAVALLTAYHRRDRFDLLGTET